MIGTDPPNRSSNANEPAAVAQVKNDPNNRTLVIHVVNRDSRTPVEGADVTVQVDSGCASLGGEPELLTRLPTDADGRCQIEFPPDLPKEIYITGASPDTPTGDTDR